AEEDPIAWRELPDSAAGGRHLADVLVAMPPWVASQPEVVHHRVPLRAVRDPRVARSDDDLREARLRRLPELEEPHLAHGWIFDPDLPHSCSPFTPARPITTPPPA